MYLVDVPVNNKICCFVVDWLQLCRSATCSPSFFHHWRASHSELNCLTLCVDVTLEICYVINVSEKTIVGFAFTSYRQCATATEPSGGAMGFTPEKLFRPGSKVVFDAGEDDPVQDKNIQDCLDTAKEIRVQIKTVSFTDGTTWSARPGDFNGIRSSSP